MQGLPQLVDRCADDFILSFLPSHDWVPDEFGPEYGYQYGEAILKNLRDFEAELRAELRGRITPRLRQWNTCAPISKLPPELLQLIFRFNLITSSGNRARGYVRTMVILRSVSWGWRALLDRSPFLWGHLTSSDHPEFVSKALESSKEAPLHLKYSRKQGDRYQSAFLDKTFPHLHRWESISVHDPTHMILAKYFTSRAPLLKRMVLSKGRVQGWHDPVCPFRGSWSLLKELRIREWRTDQWKEVQCGQLRVVDIDSCINLEISLILRLLQDNQHLEILRLNNTRFTSSTSVTHGNTPVVLPHLKDLTLTSLTLVDRSEVNNHPHHPTLHILRHFRFPSCTKFTLRLSMDEELNHLNLDPEDLLSLLPSPFDHLARSSPGDPQKSQTTRRNLRVGFSNSHLTLIMDQEPGCEFQYAVQLYHIPQSITWSWLRTALENRPGITLHGCLLDLFVTETSEMDYLVALRGLEVITRLSVRIAAMDLQEGVERRLLQILATPYTAASGTTVMAFPRLLDVEFNGWEDQGEAVLEMIKNRFGTPGVEAHRPESIVINCYDWIVEVQWDSLDTIRTLYCFTAIYFGATDRWPSWSPVPGSPESEWPSSGDGGSNSNWVAESQEGWE